MLKIFEDVDVLVTPGAAAGPARVGAYQRRGAVATLAGATARVPFHAVFNATGQPAAVVPWGEDEEGLPTSIHPDRQAIRRGNTVGVIDPDRNGAPMGAATAAGELTSTVVLPAPGPMPPKRPPLDWSLVLAG